MGLHRKYADPKCVFARKRGRRGGVRVRARKRRLKPPLPSITLFYARSLNSEIDELSACVKFKSEFRNSCVMCVTEAWSHPEVPDNTAELEAFKICRANRTLESGKSRGWGVCFYVSNKWCNELLFVTCWPFYFSR